jgi:hypothetical protein
MKNQYKMFVFGETLQKAIDQIPASEQLRFYRIIVQYGLDNLEPELSGFEAAVWVQMKAMIDNTMPKKRGAPKGNANAQKQTIENELNFENKENNSDGIDLIDSIENKENNSDGIDLIDSIENKENNSDGIDFLKTNAPMYNVNDNVNVNVNVNENEKENDNGPLSLSPFVKIPETPDLPQKNYAMIFEEVKSKWKEVTGQDTRELLFNVPPPKREKFINTLALYSLDDIFNAIGNYHLARSRPEDFDIGGRIYGNLIGFLENGVSQFFDDDVADANFRRRKNDG